MPVPGDLLLRILSAAVLIPAVLAAVFIGHSAFAVLIGFFALMMAVEWAGLCGSADSRSRIFNPPAMALIVCILAGTVLLFFNYTAMAVIWAAAAVPAIALAGGPNKPGRWWLAAGALYILVPCAALIWIRAQPGAGFGAVVWLLAVVWMTDTGAYAAGRLIGGARLAPSISPNKTWSGLAGGVIAAMLSAVLLSDVLGLSPALWLSAICAGILAIIAQGGDLFESAVKRRSGVKDSGSIIPGHGGVLDRVDGLLAAAPVAALAILAWEHIG